MFAKIYESQLTYVNVISEDEWPFLRQCLVNKSYVPINVLKYIVWFLKRASIKVAEL